MRKPKQDFDSPWKEALEVYFEQFMAFFFPEAYGEIDWTRGFEFLDKELRQIARGAALGERRVDKLVRVWREGGEEAWVLIHVEVQSQEETGFEERMYVYNYRSFDRYHRRVGSLAVLGDEQADWRPNEFGYELFGCRVGLTFPAVKLLDYGERWSELEASDNPFATIVMAHLKAREAREDPNEGLKWKLFLTRRLHERGYNNQEVLKLHHFIDWLIHLPDQLEEAYWETVREYEEVKQVPYITSVERIGIKKGIQQGVQQGLQQGLQQGTVLTAREDVLEAVRLRFKRTPRGIGLRIRQLDDPSKLKQLHRKAILAESLEEFEKELLAAVALPT
jgi:hypothetical protein